MNGIGTLAATKGVWILTTGLNSGVSQLIGRSIYRHKARTGAALLAVALAKRKASFTKEMNQRTDFMDHAAKYEDYATACINACHQQSEQRTSSILLSKKKIYGDATYMQ
ncbi:unnamed protein product, partial [Rotaria sp. Silwood1]